MTVVCRGSYLDGLNIDLVTWCELQINNEQRDIFYENLEVNEWNLLEETYECVVVETDRDEDAAPGMSDVYFEVRTEDPEKLKAAVRDAIEAIIRA